MGFFKKFGNTSSRPSHGFSSYDEDSDDHSASVENFIQKFGRVTEEYSFDFKNDDGTKETIRIRFDKVEHVYYRLHIVQDKVEWVKVPGITSVLGIKDKSAALMPWAANETANYVRAEFLDLEPEQLALVMQSPLHLQEWLFATLDDAKKNYQSLSKMATDVGHAAHDWLEKYAKAKIADNKPQMVALEDERSKMDERAISCCEAALDWMRRHNARWVMAEEKVYSRKLNVAGTLDGVCYVDSCDDPDCCPTQFKDVLSLLDWKSSNALYDSMRWQTSAYQAIVKELFGLEIQHRWVVQLGKYDGCFKPWHIYEEDFEMDFDCFDACLRLVNTTDNCVQTLRERRNAAKAAKKAIREAEVAAEKAEKARIREGKKTARAQRKEVYKEHRANGHSVAVSNQCADAWLDRELAKFGGADDDEEEKAA